jgi:hypothetical protein
MVRDPELQEGSVVGNEKRRGRRAVWLMVWDSWGLEEFGEGLEGEHLPWLSASLANCFRRFVTTQGPVVNDPTKAGMRS